MLSRKRIGCTIEVHNGRLRLRYRWMGKRYAVQTEWADTPAHRSKLEWTAMLVGAALENGRDPKEVIGPINEPEKQNPTTPTLSEYFTEYWMPQKEPPLVRRSLARDYRRHIEGHVLPRIGYLPVGDLTARDILGLLSELLQAGLSVKYVKNILGGSLKAMIRDAREIDELITRDPFIGVRWPRTAVPGPTPWTAEERDRILGWFANARYGLHVGASKEKDGDRWVPHLPYYVFAFTLFWTGLRPSEAAGLQWADVDLDGGTLRIVRSRHMYEDNAPKTAQAMRVALLVPENVRLLARMRPEDAAPDAYVFTSTRGGPVEPKSFSEHWYRCLEELGVKPKRGLYTTKDTYISLALTAGVNISWLEEQTGVRYETMRRHYGRFMRQKDDGQLGKMIGPPAERPEPMGEGQDRR